MNRHGRGHLSFFAVCAVRGRAISRQSSSDHQNGRGLIVSLISYAQSQSGTQATKVQAAIKGWIQRELGFFMNISLFSKEIAAFEFGNGENSQGWWTGMGMTALYS